MQNRKNYNFDAMPLSAKVKHPPFGGDDLTFGTSRYASAIILDIYSKNDSKYIYTVTDAMDKELILSELKIAFPDYLIYNAVMVKGINDGNMYRLDRVRRDLKCLVDVANSKDSIVLEKRV